MRLGCPDSLREGLRAREQSFREEADDVGSGAKKNCSGAEGALGKGQGG